MLSTDPPLLPHCKLALKVQKEISARHGSSREEMRAHPTILKIIRRRPVSKDVHEQFPSHFQCPCDLGHHEFIILQMLKELDRDDPIKTFRLKLIFDNVSCDDIEIYETFADGLSVDVILLRP